MSVVKPGFIGIAFVPGIGAVRCSQMNMDLVQKPEFYDHVYGVLDGNANQPQKPLWRPGTKIVRGSISFPCAKQHSDIPFFDLAKIPLDFPITMNFTCGIQRNASNCKVEKFSIQCTAGGLLEVSVSFSGISIDEGSSGVFSNQISEKLITWDVVDVDFHYATSFSFNISNPIIPIYTAGQNRAGKQLFPYELRVGIQTIDGSITYYKTENESVNDVDDDQIDKFVLSTPIGGFSANVIYTPFELPSNIGAISGVAKFTGIGDYWS